MMAAVPSVLRPEAPSDRAAVRDVNTTAFGGSSEADLVDALRAGGFSIVSLVAVEEETIVGHILFSRLRIESGTRGMDAAALAPLAVRPAYQHRGIGSSLVREGLKRCRQAGESVVVVVGHPGFYPRFGFSHALGAKLESKYAGESFMALELEPSALAGVSGEVVYPAPFEAF
jgi:putative acetyltransferase